jgi:hypothetical protein
MDSQRFSELRSHLTQPSSEHWQALLTLLTFWPEGEGREIALEYALTHLDEWPDSLRKTATTRLDAALWPLFRSLDSSFQRIAYRRVRFLAEWGGLQNITDLTLSENKLMAAGYLELSKSPHLRTLHSLRCANTEADDIGLSAFLTRFPLDALKTLKASSNDLTEQFVQFLERQPELALESLDLSSNPLHQRGLKQLLEGSILRSCRHLKLNSHPSLYKEIETLVHNPEIRQLESLSFTLSPMVGDALLHLGQGSWSHLQELELSFCDADNFGLQRMFEQAQWPSLTSLDLSGNEMGPGACRALAENTSFGLQELRLRDNPLGDEGLFHLSRAKWLPSLKTLDLRSTFGDEGGLGDFLSSEGLHALNFLSLESNTVEEESFLMLMEAGSLQSLQTLYLSDVQLSSDAMLGLTQAPSITSLRELRLSNSAHELDCFEHLQQAEFRDSLRILDLRNAELTNEHLRELEYGEPFARLHSLILNENPFDDEGLSLLGQAAVFPALKTLSLWGCTVSVEGLLHLIAQPSFADVLVFLNKDGFSEREYEELKQKGGNQIRCA